MRFVMKEKLLCFGDDYYIKDEQGRDAFFVDGKAFTMRDKLSFQDLQGNELAFIQQRMFAWGPTYDITSRGQHIATVKKQIFSFLNCRFFVDVPGPNDLTAEGNFLHHEYVFKRQDRQVAQVSKHWFSWSDTYGVDIHHEEDALLVLASTVVIDQVCHDEHRH